MKRSLKKGLPGGPNEKVFSKEGYRSTSPDVNNSFNFIPSGNITMKEKDGTPLKKGPLLGIDNLGNSKLMLPGANYQFPGDVVKEVPLAKKGGPFQNSNIYATNKLFAKNPLFKKRKKGKKAKGIYNPKAKYTYQPGGQIEYNQLPNNYKDALKNFVYPEVVDSSEETGYDAAMGVIKQNPNDPIANVNNPWWMEHELFHHLQNQAGAMSTYGTVGQRPNPYVASDEAIGSYYDRRGAEFDIELNKIFEQNPNMSEEEAYALAEENLYRNPTSVEGEARNYEGYIEAGNPSMFNKKADGGEAACPEGFYNDPVKGCVAIEDPSTFYENWYKNRVMPTAEGQKLLEKIRPEALERASQNVPYIYSEELNPNEAGYYDPETQEIFLNKDLPEAQIEATKFHERGHHIQAGDKFSDVLEKPHQYLVEQNIVEPKEINTGNPEWDKNLKKNFDEITNANELQQRAMKLRYDAGFQPNQVITVKDVEDFFKRKKEAGEALDPDIEDLKGVTKGNQGIVNLLNDMVSVPSNREDLQVAKYGFELDLTEDEIQKYVKGGYVVEDISVPSLTRMQFAGEVPDSTYTPIDPNFLAENPDTYSKIVNKPEVTSERQGSDIGKLRAEFREKNPMDIFLDEKKRQFLKKNKGLNKAAGNTMEKFPEDVLQNFIKEYEYKTNNYAVNKLGKKEGWNPKRRGEWVDELTPGERDAVAESKYGSKLQPTYWSRTLAGLGTLVSKFSPEVRDAMNKGYMPGLTKKESQEILNAKMTKFPFTNVDLPFTIPIGGLESLSFTEIPGTLPANYIKNTGLSTGSDYKELPSWYTGEKMANVEDKDVTALNLLTYAGLETIPELGVNLVKGVGKGIAKGYDAVATGNSILPIAWKVEETSPLKSILQNKNYNLTDEEAAILNEYINNPYKIKSSPEKSKIFTNIIQKNQVDLSGINQPISRYDNYYVSSYDREPLPTKYGSTFSFPRDRSWSIGIDNNAGTRLTEKQRLVIPSRYAKKLNENFHAVNYSDPRLPEALSRPYEKELIGNVPEGFKVIGTNKEGNIENIIIKPLKKDSPKTVSTLPISDKLKQFFDRPPGPLMIGLGGSEKFTRKVPYPDYYLSIMKLNKYNSKQKKYFEDLIESVKTQGNVATERQYDELQRIKTGDYNYGKKGFAEGGVVSELTKKQIDKLIKQGFIIEEID